MKLNKKVIVTTIENWEDGPFDSEYGCVQVLSIAENIELYMIIAEPQHVPLLQVVTDIVLLLPPSPDHPRAGDSPARLV